MGENLVLKIAEMLKRQMFECDGRYHVGMDKTTAEGDGKEEKVHSVFDVGAHNK